MNDQILANLGYGLEITLFGLAGVFGVLLIFYFVILLLGKIKVKESSEEN